MIQLLQVDSYFFTIDIQLFAWVSSFHEMLGNQKFLNISKSKANKHSKSHLM
jgi:hypothetical protein